MLLILGTVLLFQNGVDAQHRYRCRGYLTEDECYADLHCFWFGPFHIKFHHTVNDFPAFCDTWEDKY